MEAYDRKEPRFNESAAFDCGGAEHHNCFMNAWKALLLLTGLMLGCGGKSTSGTAQMATDGGSADAGDFGCGNATCKAAEICYYPPYGCIGFSVADGSACPSGTQPSETTGECVQSAPTPSCVSADSLKGESVTCTPSVDDANCDIVTPPIPSGCSHVCRGICV